MVKKTADTQCTKTQKKLTVTPAKWAQHCSDVIQDQTGQISKHPLQQRSHTSSEHI